MKRQVSAVVLVVAIGAAVLFGPTSDGGVPSEEDVRREFAEVTSVVVDKVHPVYYYSDFDALLAVVCPRPEQTPAQLAQLARRWTIREARPGYVLLERQSATGFELVKLLRARDGCIAVGTMHVEDADSRSFESSGEATFGREVVWPQVDEVAVRRFTHPKALRRSSF